MTRSQRLREPQGLLLLPPKTAAIAGYDVVVADTVNHRLRGLKLESGEVTTVAGSGHPWRSTVDDHSHDALAADLSSPWDLAWYDDRVIVAMAGIHQLWWFDPVKRTVGVYAGTTVESLRDGPLPDVWMAQPSGLSAAGDQLWIADSETSALRWIENGALHTAVGQGLFDFGHVDGRAEEALLQHPLGVAALPDGDVLIADTYNGAIRRFDPMSRDRHHRRFRTFRAERRPGHRGRRGLRGGVRRAPADPAGSGSGGERRRRTAPHRTAAVDARYPIIVATGGPDRLPLVLRGLDT